MNTDTMTKVQDMKFGRAALAVAKLFEEPIRSHKSPAELEIVGAMRQIFGSDPELMMGLVLGNLFGEVNPEAAAELERVEAELEQLRLRVKELMEQKKALKGGKSKEEQAIEEFLSAGLKSLLAGGKNILPAAMDYSALGYEEGEIPEAPVKKGRPAGDRNAKKEGEVPEAIG